MKINREDRDWYYTKIGNLVKFARESQRLTQRALANKAGVQLNTVRGIEEGRRFNADNAVGRGGQATSNQLLANGASSSIAGDNITTITASGGTAGNTHNLSASQAYNQKLMTQFSESTFSGSVVQIIPNAIFGETTIFGEGGNWYKYGHANAVGNCASGGTSEPYLNTSNKIEISPFRRMELSEHFHPVIN